MDLTELRKKQREERLGASFMTASSVLTWIAFRDPDPLAWQEETKTYERIIDAVPGLGFLQAMALVRQVREGPELTSPELLIVDRELEVERDRRVAIQAATRTLLKEICNKRLSAYGRKDIWNRPSSHRRLPITIFMDSRVTITTRDRVQQDANLLNGGIDGGPGYCEVKFKTAEVLSIWEHASPKAQPTDQRRTGTAGRPSSKALAAEKMRLRAIQGVLAPTLAEEARYLCAWLLSDHPDEPQPTAKSLSEPIRAEYKQLRDAENRRPR